MRCLNLFFLTFFEFAQTLSAQKIELKLFAPVKGLLKTNLIEDEGQDMGQSGKILNLNICWNSIETYKLKL